MKFNVGDLIIIKDYLNNNKRVPAYIVEVHPIDQEDEDGYWWSPSITYKLPSGNTCRQNISAIEGYLNDPKKRDRWYHHPVKE